MRILSMTISLLFLLAGLVATVNAGEEKRHSGVETSAEHKSEQGLEHGKAYAGTKEKKVKEEGATEEDEAADDEEATGDEEATDEEGDDGKGKGKTEKSEKGKKSK